MKIYYLSHSHIPSKFANSIQVMHMCQAFLQNGHKLTLFAKTGTTQTEDDFSYYGLERHFPIIKSNRPKNIFGGLIYTRLNYKKVKNVPLPDLFYGRDPFSLWSIRHLGAPMIFEVHSSPRNRIDYWCQKQIFNNPNFSGLVPITHALKKEYTRVFPQLREEKIFVAPDGAPLNNFVLGNKSPLPDWPGRSNALQIGYLGHLYKGKGMDIIIQTAKKLPDVDFHIVGGMPEQITYWENQSRTIDNLCFHGFKSPGEVYQYLQKMDIVLAPYQKKVIIKNHIKDDIGRWTSPLKIFEYMSAAKAIIASDLPVIREILTHDSTAYLVNPKDPDEWVEAVNRLNEYAYRKKLGEQARREFEDNYTWEQRAYNVLQTFSKGRAK